MAFQGVADAGSPRAGCPFPHALNTNQSHTIQQTQEMTGGGVRLTAGPSSVRDSVKPAGLARGLSSSKGTCSAVPR